MTKEAPIPKHEGPLCHAPSGDQPVERQYDLGERTARFCENVIQFVKTVKLTAITAPLVEQLIRSSSSIGANYGEADEAGSKKEFRYRISLCKREAKESKHWLRMLAAAVPESKDQGRLLWKEANELTLIFAAIYRKSSQRAVGHYALVLPWSLWLDPSLVIGTLD